MSYIYIYIYDISHVRVNRWGLQKKNSPEPREGLGCFSAEAWNHARLDQFENQGV